MAKLGARSDCNKHVIKREHYAKKEGDWKPKQKFETETEALAWIKNIKCIDILHIFARSVENGI